jgi:hypothetical protein
MYVYIAAYTMDIVTILIICIVLLVLWNMDIYTYFTTRSVNAYNGRTYAVATAYTDQQRAADTMASLDMYSKKLIDNMVEDYYVTNNCLKDCVTGSKFTKLLTKRYNSNMLFENIPLSDDTTSFVRNKGDLIALCLREKLSGLNMLHDLSTLQFVLMHELAHIVSTGPAHDDEFWENFKFILQYAEQKKMYTNIDYSARRTPYCGIWITYNPVYDGTLPSYF